jgi:hypothetical protein
MRRSNLWLILTVLDTSPHRDPEEGVSSSVSWLSSVTLLGCGNESETTDSSIDDDFKELTRRLPSQESNG